MAESLNSGVYAIYNQVNGKCYVGHSSSLNIRWLTHQSQLRRGIHHCQPLQNAWRKYGPDALQFKVLELVPCDRIALYLREQFWIDLIAPAYNVMRIARPGWLGMRHTEEARRKISEFHKNDPKAIAHRAALHAAKRGVPRPPETIAKMRASRVGKKHSPETIARLKAIAAASTWKPTPEHREKLRAANLGRQDTPERLAKFRAKMVGRKQPPEQIAKRVAKLIGHTTSDYTKQRTAEANRARLLGTKQSPELIEKRISKLRGRKRPDVTLARKGIPRLPHVVEAIRAGHLLRWSARAAEIKAAILANPGMSITKLAKSIGADRETVSKYKKELQCQPQPPNANVSAGSASQPVQAVLFPWL